MADLDYMDPTRRRVVPPPPPQFQPAGIPGIPPASPSRPAAPGLQPIGQPDMAQFGAANAAIGEAPGMAGPAVAPPAGPTQPAPGTAPPTVTPPTTGQPTTAASTATPTTQDWGTSWDWRTADDAPIRNSTRGAELARRVAEQIGQTGNGTPESRANIEAQIMLGGPGSYGQMSSLTPDVALLLYEGGFIDEAEVSRILTYHRDRERSEQDRADSTTAAQANAQTSREQGVGYGEAAGGPLAGFGDQPAWYTAGLDALRAQLDASASAGERDIREWASSRGVVGGSPELVNFADLTGQLRASEMSGLADLEQRGAEYGFAERGLGLQERALELEALGIEKNDAYRWAALSSDNAFRQKALDFQQQGMEWDQAFRQAEQEWRQESDLRNYGLQTQQAGFDQKKYHVGLAQWFVENGYPVPDWLDRQLKQYGVGR
jgi:hypothetical protein